VSEKANNHLARNEATILGNDLKDFKFIFSLVVWYDILHRINIINKLMHDPQLELSAVVRLMEETQVFLKHYRKTGFEEAKITSTELAESVYAEAVFPAAVQIRVRHKRLFDYESRDDPIQDPKTCCRIENFNVIDCRTLFTNART